MEGASKGAARCSEGTYGDRPRATHNEARKDLPEPRRGCPTRHFWRRCEGDGRSPLVLAWCSQVGRRTLGTSHLKHHLILRNLAEKQFHPRPLTEGCRSASNYTVYIRVHIQTVQYRQKLKVQGLQAFAVRRSATAPTAKVATFGWPVDEPQLQAFSANHKCLETMR